MGIFNIIFSNILTQYYVIICVHIFENLLFSVLFVNCWLIGYFLLKSKYVVLMLLEIWSETFWLTHIDILGWFWLIKCEFKCEVLILTSIQPCFWIFIRQHSQLSLGVTLFVTLQWNKNKHTLARLVFVQTLLLYN